MLFHDFSLRSILRSRFLSQARERRWHDTEDGCTYARVVAKRAVCGRSQIATVNCNFLALSEAQLDDRLSRAFLTR